MMPGTDKNNKGLEEVTGILIWPSATYQRHHLSCRPEKPPACISKPALIKRADALSDGRLPAVGRGPDSPDLQGLGQRRQAEIAKRKILITVPVHETRTSNRLGHCLRDGLVHFLGYTSTILYGLSEHGRNNTLSCRLSALLPPSPSWRCHSGSVFFKASPVGKGTFAVFDTDWM